MLTVAAFVLIGLLVVVACEATRARFQRLLAQPDVQPLDPTVRGEHR